ncbi:MAG: phosphoribosylanthranilate isomerase [Planctomycetes bacterium]|nr:phosphoribosylanthranilate isomerase [Planctomycetota bacterium]
MRANGRTFVKVCCIQSIDEAELALRAGASALGLVSAMPSGPGVIDEATIAEIAAWAARDIETFLLTALTDADAIVAQHARCRTTTLQLVDHVPEAELVALRRALPAVRLVQVLHVRGPETLDEARAAAAHVDGLLLDSGNPALAVKELGGTGRTHDWKTSRAIRESVRLPVLLAGGLRAENVGAALATVEPFGLDVCSGVRRADRLDPERLAAFFAAVAASRR